MADEIRRLKYFKGEFLQEKEFQDEQYYHRRLRYLHNGYLHTPGIVYGLDVKETGQKQVTVTPGMGIVRIVEDGEELGKEVVLTTNFPIDLPGGPNAQIYIVVEFDDSNGDTPDLQGRNMRTVERPKLSAIIPNPTATPEVLVPDNRGELILAKVTLDVTGNAISNVDMSPDLRLQAGMSGDVEAANVRFRIPGELDATKWPSIIGLPPIANLDPIRLKITVPRLDLSGDLLLSGGNIVFSSTGGGLVDGIDVSTHDHSSGKGGAVAWSSLTAIPTDLLFIKAYAVVEIVNGMVQPITRSYGMPANPVNRDPSTKQYTVTWTTSQTKPLVLINLRCAASKPLYCQVVTTANTQVLFNANTASGTADDPLGFMILVI